MKRYSIFNHLYNALRVLLHDSAIILQQSDFSDGDEAATVLLRIDEVVGFCESHMEIEDKFIYPLFENSKLVLPDCPQRDRIACSTLLQQLKEFVICCESSLPAMEKINIADKFISKFTRLLIIQLEFSERKENILNKVLSLQYNNDDLVSVRNDVIDFIPVAKRSFFYKWLLRGMKNAEVIYWLQEAKENASEQIFHSLLSTAEQTIPERQWKRIQDAVVEGEMLA